MLKTFLAIGSLAILAAAGGAAPDQSAGASNLHRERIEWCDIWFTDAGKDALPRVLFIGDSITRGYFDPAEKALAGQAYCSRLTTSRSVCDPVFFEELRLVLSQYDFAMIHFNNGLHGWAYTEEEYRAGLEEFVAALKEQAPEAALVWASTTPVRDDSGMKDNAARVAARNTIASEIMSKEGIATDNLHALATDHPEYLGSDGVHFESEGRQAQGEQVAAHVEEALEAQD